MLNKKKEKKNNANLAFILIWPIIASILSFLFQASLIFSIVLFLGFPAVYLSIFNPRYIKKISIFSIIVVPLAIIADNIMTRTGGWTITNSAFGSFRLLGYTSIEQIIWLFLYVYLVSIFYESFLDKHIKVKNYFPKLKYLLIIWLVFFGLFVIYHIEYPEMLNINYFYLKAGILLVALPIALMLAKFPALYAKFFKTSAYFFFLSFIYEITALKLNQWSFSGEHQFLGFIRLFGISFPFEELLFWIILGGMGVLTYFEFFDDDKK